MLLEIKENGIYLIFEITDEKEVLLLHCSCFFDTRPFTAIEKKKRWFRLVELQISGYNQDDHHGGKHTGTSPGSLLRYVTHFDGHNDLGRLLKIVQNYHGIEVETYFQFYDGLPVIRSWNTVTNSSNDSITLEYLSSFALTGLCETSKCPKDQGALVYIPHNTWFGEAQWKSYTLNELGYHDVMSFSLKRIACSNTGSWACEEYLPMGAYEHFNLKKTLLWQIETSGSWHWEIGDISDELYLQLSGPTGQENGFYKTLKKTEVFTSVPCAVVVVEGNYFDAVRAITEYRRRIRRKNSDNIHLPVVFNDYMNCLMGDPTTEKLLPLIDKAEEVGCEYFCIDCGWYDDGPWWDGVGEWNPSQRRFPEGIKEVLAYIRDKNMKPGLWLEIEVMGIHCPLVKKVPADWLFQRNGKPVIDHSRYQLDFRNPEVRAYADRVIDRLVAGYGVAYLKMDYNINAGVGTDCDSDSAGEGLLEHTRAYLNWLDQILDRYPGLVIENCASGGMRMEYSHLSRLSIQSVTDQEDYLKMSAIAANCMTACTPEQAAIWSYPLANGDEEEVIYNMINAMLLRIHQSGNLDQLAPERLRLVKEGITCYRKFRQKIPGTVPFWPIGLGTMKDDYLCVGLDYENGKEAYLAVWRTKNNSKNKSLEIPLDRFQDQSIECVYPTGFPCNYDWSDGILSISLDPGTARLFHIKS